ncbi:MAG TPA: phosphodiesterase [Moraxellaceae bacterium]|nr:phosphodiesterase [Moraxellaceae bacterium]
MKRRDFIRIGGFLTASVATLGLTGCSIDGEDDESSLFPSATPEPVRAMPAAAIGATWKFPQSIASADPRPDSIILWTRVVPTTVVGATASSNVNTAIRLVVTAADNSANIGTITALSGTLVADVTVPAYADFDNSVRHKLTGLSAASVYYYQFIAGDVRSNVGRFKTAPAITSSDDVKFIFMSCQDWSANHWGAFDQIVADDATPAAPDVDFIVHLGDYIYETDSVAAAESSLHSAVTLPVGASLPTGGNYAVELADYRYLYKLYRSDTRIQKVHERFPIVAVWDDHEFSDDGWQTAETYTNTNSPMFQRRRNANQAWFEFMPADVSFSEVDPGFQNIKLYRDLKFGATMHLVMTDERLYRQDHLIPESTINPATGLPLGRINSRYLAPEASLKSAELQKDFAGAPLGPLGLISILGQTQRDWWKSTMLNSTSTWKVWGNEVSLLRMGLNGTNAVTTLLTLQILQTASTAGSPLLNKVPASAAAVAAGTMGISDTTAAATGALQIEAIIGADTSNTTKQSAAIATAAATFGGGVATATTTAIATIATNAYIAAYNQQAAVFGATGNATLAANAGAAAGASVIVQGIGATPTHPLRAFLQKFILNADQWDGYSKERADLMKYLVNNSIQNVVAVTGDIHAFFAGTVYTEFQGEVRTITAGGTEATAAPSNGDAAMVDLVTAGISSTSWFNYLKTAAAALSAQLVTLVSATASSAQTGLPFDVILPVLDFTMGKPYSLSALNLMARDAVKLGAAANGIPESLLPATPETIGAGIASSAQLQGLCQALAALGTGTNPWLSHIDTSAQGYAVVTASTTTLSCEFKRLNTLFVTGGTGYAPGVVEARTVADRSVVATVTAGTAAVVMSTPV